MGIPLISVITVSYNSVDYIEDCIKSVVSQGFDDYEYIVIDGKSTDGTPEIINRYARNLAYWHSRPDRGLSHAFNLGVANSSGKWLLFLNSDDYLAGSSVLSEMSYYLKNNSDADVVFGKIMFVSMGKNPKIISGPLGRPFSRRKFFFKDTILHPAAFTNRKYFKKAGLFNEDFTIAMDYEHYLRGGSSLKVFHAPLVISNMRMGGISKLKIFTTYSEWRKAHLKNKTASKFIINIVYLSLISKSIIDKGIKFIKKL
ncbi:MAG: hypothetical protein DRG59_06700 [Deltaproteobacteria bacterium]|nr:MAG: hypothetical protein DRG59_06700 [Deltaproteobacteria bacterium]